MQPEQRRFLIAEFLLAALGAAALIHAFTADAGAHQAPSGFAYPAICCNGNREHGDCQPIAEQTVKPVAGGYRLTLGAGRPPHGDARPCLRHPAKPGQAVAGRPLSRLPLSQ